LILEITACLIYIIEGILWSGFVNRLEPSWVGGKVVLRPYMHAQGLNSLRVDSK
jgi:hypothetical protein